MVFSNLTDSMILCLLLSPQAAEQATGVLRNNFWMIYLLTSTLTTHPQSSKRTQVPVHIADEKAQPPEHGHHLLPSIHCKLPFPIALFKIPKAL